ncbi:2-succinyl-6-hydroxy-2,4-cyclohexadiene-1-carboxylate synthase [Corallococcus exiguus]|uniref:2-succinyl-6-hydroxy-2, 4-cyclohexadiene-1-carboxylate synthase n=1 Tax=Corallococcus TaxID=83461 RepID=UPI000EE06272|nr:MULTISPECIES: 2-succinyl-6-hydroxy-2,4-cyclohexadiene-1-carboxylate synthase [Corallococcus]NNB87556.1 2-succinyl-6-hydroxy-2,4-cyclohexadiene-1-carboxylate synthase [Corallococcus exiguus]NNB94778.1 2-succinyl-6-hydroxy-2,4-cyclohexadiene-1-carboxylate synthase [Corallococcus exiguus]NNC01702.1 2-succinyl-6-hydroxy-2,4-cyclohexadiene-1-carboxylate synthase [Corallococcus exiguus]NPC48481.1 2-succinyl-6-hydroxy-2,4-cyclohexadiene-1-carboxylate synthase [Corallococcus exiguus]RKH84481.1 2-su
MGVTLAYDSWGEGPHTLLALHGFTGSGATFEHLRPLLGRSVRVVAVDLPGHGRTPLPEKTGRDGFLETVDAVVQLARELGGQVDLLGYSQGARVALGAAVRAPDCFGRLIMESGSPGLHRRQERSERREADAKLVDFIRAKGVDAFVERWEALPLFDGLRRLPDPEQAALRERRKACTAQGLAGALETLGLGVQPDYWPALHRQRLPTLLLTGDQDEKFTTLARRMAAELPVVWRHAFAGVTHAPHLEAPEEYVREVLSFLQTPWYEAPQFEHAILAREATHS